MVAGMSPADVFHQSPADIVFSGGPILTMDAARSRPEAVAVRDGRVVAVGSSDEVEGLVGKNTERVALDGRTLLPGLIDAHVHSAMVQLADWVDVSPMATPTTDAVHSALRGATATRTGWVLAQQFDPSITEGHPRLDRQTLDRLVPDRPLLVLESNGHIAWVNSEAMKRACVDRATPDPGRSLPPRRARRADRPAGGVVGRASLHHRFPPGHRRRPREPHS